MGEPVGGEDVIRGESRVDAIGVQAELPVGQAAGGSRRRTCDWLSPSVGNVVAARLPYRLFRMSIVPWAAVFAKLF